MFGRVAIAQTMRDSLDLMDILGTASSLSGEHGDAADGGAEYLFRPAGPTGIYGGTLEVFRNMIAHGVSSDAELLAAAKPRSCRAITCDANSRVSPKPDRVKSTIRPNPSPAVPAGDQWVWCPIRPPSWSPNAGMPKRWQLRTFGSARHRGQGPSRLRSTLMMGSRPMSRDAAQHRRLVPNSPSA